MIFVSNKYVPGSTVLIYVSGLLGSVTKGSQHVIWPVGNVTVHIGNVCNGNPFSSLRLNKS